MGRSPCYGQGFIKEEEKMTQKVLAARGLPGSGKSYYLRQFNKDVYDQPNPGSWFYIERDYLREIILDGKKWTPKREGEVVKKRNEKIRSALSKGWNVIIDETFLNPKMIDSVTGIIKQYEAQSGNEVEFEIKDFTDVDISLCIERDRTRGKRSVGAGVIRENAKKWLRQPEPEIIHEAVDAIICDLDGTLALFDGGKGKAYDRDWLLDTPNWPIVHILESMKKVGRSYTQIFITSGRIDTSREATEKWLADNNIPYDKLFMRPESRRSERDWLFKKDVYEKEILGKYNVLFVLDDRDQVVDMWRSLGLTCLQCDYGNF